MGKITKKKNFVESFQRMIDGDHYVKLTDPVHYYHFEGNRINALINDIFYGTDAETNEPLAFYVNRYEQALSIINPEIVTLFKRNLNLFVLNDGIIVFWNQREIYLTIDLEDLFVAVLPEEISFAKYDIVCFAKDYNGIYHVKLYKLEDGSMEKYQIFSYINLGATNHSIKLKYVPMKKVK